MDVFHIGLSYGRETALPGLDAEGIRIMERVAATLLLSSFGYAVQFMHGLPPSGLMNRMRAQIDSLTTP